jgi:hypothetical protein
MPAASPDNPMGNSQKYMAYIMPFFALTGLYWPFGLVLYWVTTNVWTLIQQWALFKRYPYTPPSADGTVAATAGAAGTVGARALAPNKPTVKTTVVKSSAAKGSGPTAKTDTKAGSSSGQNGTGPSANGSSRAKPGAGSSTDGGSGGRSGGSGSTSGGSGSAMKRRLGRGRAEQPQQPEPAEVKLVRQQKQRQSRSKRSGKR